MKYFKLTYYLLFICIVATACSTDAQDIVDADRTKEDIRVQLTIQFPEAATRATDEGTQSERMINNLHLYIFEANDATHSTYSYKEEASVIAVSNNNGSATRTILALLSKSYTRDIKIVALANLDNKGLDFSMLPTTTGTSLSAFYEKLIFSRTNIAQWPAKNESSLPMCGECDMNIPSIGNNTGNLSLTRAIAKVDVLVNNGSGITDKAFFKIVKIEVGQYNDRGYCAAGSATNEPNVPADANRVTTPLEYAESNPSYACVNRIYIPEQKNVGAAENQKVFLNLTAAINEAGETKVFRIDFKKDGTGADFDILRNNAYVFNITSVKTEQEKFEVSFTYKVVEWDKADIGIEFN